MSVEDLITKIFNKVKLNCFELEYDYKCNNNSIDLRLYGASYSGAEIVKAMIEAFDFVGVTDVNVEEPTEDEVKYAFCGYKFMRVAIGVDRNVARSENEHLLFNDAGRML